MAETVIAPFPEDEGATGITEKCTVPSSPGRCGLSFFPRRNSPLPKSIRSDFSSCFRLSESWAFVSMVTDSRPKVNDNNRNPRANAIGPKILHSYFRNLPNFYLGVGYNLDYFYGVVEEDPTPETPSDFKQYGIGTGSSTTSSGITVNILRDNRKTKAV